MPNTTLKHNRFVRRTLGTVIAILLILIVLSGTLLSMRLIDYIKVDDKEVRLTTNMDDKLELFSVQYENASGEITVSGMQGQKVVAPGTSEEYTIRLRNTDKIALDCELIPKITYTSEYRLPILIRMLDTQHNYIIGDEKTWMAIEDITELSASKTLVKGESAEYYFQWKWDFETGNDAYDTELGEAAKKENVGLKVALTVHAEANTQIGTNGGIMKSGLGDIIAAGIAFILLCIAIALTVIVFVKKRKEATV
ncbi:MAG: hypothetical protein IKC95_03110 [Oscillospiraceae bacterium]|nr:hypothetical protein [Oscillospiraceae bacterium]